MDRSMCRLASSLVVVFLLSSCIPMPASEEPFRGGQVERIVPGVTTRDEVRAMFGRALQGSGPSELRGGEWWRYRASRDMGGVLIVLAGPMGVGPLFPIADGTRQYSLLLRFSDDIVAEYAVVHDGRPCDLERGLCYSDNRFMRLADESVEAAVELFEAPTGQCRVHIFDDGYRNLISVFVNSERIGYLMGEEAYYHRDLQPGTHQVDVEPPPLHAPNQFECMEGELVFVRITARNEFDPASGPIVQRVRAREARRIVRLRRLAIRDPDFWSPYH